MRTVRHASELNPGGRPVSLAVGMFDGVHLGHQQVIRQAATDAEQAEGVAAVVTFDRHPASVLAPQHAPPLIYPLERKLREIEALGIEACWLIAFDEAFSRQTGEEFVRALARHCPGIRSICVGSAFAFGWQRSGDVSLLRRLGAELGFAVHGLAAVALGGHTVSSTRIREAIRSGKLDQAQQMMGREYALCGKVVEGDRIGRTLGFPTANLDAAALVLPPGGVYAAHAVAGPSRCRAVLNIGRRPTLRQPQPQLRVEAHLLDFDGDLYGQQLQITFSRKLREERRFASLDELRAQIQRDIAAARAHFSASAPRA